MIVHGERCGPFVLLRDVQGRRHALRGNAIVGMSETDEIADETVLTIQGGRSLIVRASLDEVIAWFA